MQATQMLENYDLTSKLLAISLDLLATLHEHQFYQIEILEDQSISTLLDMLTSL